MRVITPGSGAGESRYVLSSLERRSPRLDTDPEAEQARAIEATIQRLGPRWFVLRDVHTDEGPVLLQPRHAMSFLRGR